MDLYRGRQCDRHRSDNGRPDLLVSERRRAEERVDTGCDAQTIARSDGSGDPFSPERDPADGESDALTTGRLDCLFYFDSSIVTRGNTWAGQTAA